MTIKDAIIRKIDKLVLTTPQITVRYKFDGQSNLHIIEISPESALNLDIVKQWEVSTLSSLFKEFPTEEVCFISERDDTLHLENVDYKKTNLPFFVLSTAYNIPIYTSFTQTAVSGSFDNTAKVHKNRYTTTELRLVA